MKVGLILIGGSLRGIYAHTGIISALQDQQIKPELVLGASAGSIVAALYASGKDLHTMYRLMATLTPEDYLDVIPRWKLLYEFVVNQAKSFSGFVEGKQLENYIKTHLGRNDRFSRCIVPLYISAVNLRTEQVELFSTGRISEKVRASAAIPMLFMPKKIDNDYYIDGALNQYELPTAMHDLRPDLDVIIVSHVDSEIQAAESAFIPDNRFPIFDIVRKALKIKDTPRWPKKIGNTRVIHIHPKVRTPVNIFKPDKYLARAVYHEAKTYAKYRLRKELEKLKKT